MDANRLAELQTLPEQRWARDIHLASVILTRLYGVPSRLTLLPVDGAPGLWLAQAHTFTGAHDLEHVKAQDEGEAAELLLGAASAALASALSCGVPVQECFRKALLADQGAP